MRRLESNVQKHGIVGCCGVVPIYQLHSPFSVRSLNKTSVTNVYHSKTVRRKDIPCRVVAMIQMTISSFQCLIDNYNKHGKKSVMYHP